MRYAFIEEHRPMWRLKAMCRALHVTKAGYFAWRNAPASRRRDWDSMLTVRIKAIHAQYDRNYGSPRIERELQADGIPVARKRVARLMREAGISANQPRRFVVTTDSKHDRPIAENLLDQDFSAERPNQRWVTDITYVPTHEGWLFLAAVMDLYSRRIVGWAMDATMTTRLVLGALHMAIGNRQPDGGLVHHSDRGSQYASEEYRASLTAHRMIPSMSRTACCYDNAAMESFWATLKRELVHRHSFACRMDAQNRIFQYIEGFYNRVRRHSSLGYLAPEAFERLSNHFRIDEPTTR